MNRKLQVIGILLVGYSLVAMESATKKRKIGTHDSTNRLIADMTQENPDVEKIAAHLNAGVNPNEHIDRLPLLSYAAKHGWYPICDILISKGAQVNISGFGPLHAASNYGCLRTCQLLLSRGANCEALDTNRFTPLLRAAYRGHTEIVRLLLDAGANLSARDKDGWTALDNAANNGHYETCKLLLERGAHIQSRAHRSTALNCATRKKHIAICTLLITHAYFPLPPFLHAGYATTPKMIRYAYLSLLHKGLPKHIIEMILLHAPSMRDRIARQLERYHTTENFNSISLQLKLILRNELYKATIDRLKPIMEHAANQTDDTTLKNNILNPELLEQNFGATIWENIGKRLGIETE